MCTKNLKNPVNEIEHNSFLQGLFIQADLGWQIHLPLDTDQQWLGWQLPFLSVGDISTACWYTVPAISCTERIKLPWLVLPNECMCHFGETTPKGQCAITHLFPPPALVTTDFSDGGASISWSSWCGDTSDDGQLTYNMKKKIVVLLSLRFRGLFFFTD